MKLNTKQLRKQKNTITISTTESLKDIEPYFIKREEPMLTLDEAIQHCIEKSKQECKQCAREHYQLALWLLELKYYRANKEKDNRED